MQGKDKRSFLGKLALTPSIVLIRNWTGLLNLALSFKHYTLHFRFSHLGCVLYIIVQVLPTFAAPLAIVHKKNIHEHTISLRFLGINYLESYQT